ncbi:MAG: protein translocase subunit SecD [Candidatus Latescibacterota bacterium]
MKKNWKLLLILGLVLAAVYYLYPTVQYYGLSAQEKADMARTDPARMGDLQRKSINLGLDLQGGIHLVMEVQRADLPEKDAADAVARAQEVIRNRIDQFGVAEPTIQRQGEDRIIVELPGVQDIGRAKNLIGQTALLEFQLLEPGEERNRILQRLDAVLGRKAARDTTAADTAQTQEEGGLFEEAERQAETGKARTLSGYLATLGEDVVVTVEDLPAVRAMLEEPKAQDLIPKDAEFIFSSQPEGPQTRPYHRLYLVRRRPEMTGSVVQDAFVSMGQSVEYLGQPVVNFITTDEGVRTFSRITGQHVGDRLAIVLDGKAYSAPVIQTRIRDGRSIITGSATEAEAKDLAIVLRAGALPAKVEIIEDRTVGPSLGRDSIDRSKTVATYAVIIVVLFMVLYYRQCGIIADTALMLNALFMLAILAGFHATLTLPGIAGIVLTIGMAVDANVLIYERIREELRGGKTVRAAVESGYQNALSAIIDSNITTLIAGVVLYQFGTGPIRGFALTLNIGIITSLFTAVFVTRTILNHVTRHGQTESLSIGPVHFMANADYNFLGRYKQAFAISGLLLLAGLVSILLHKGLRTGIDFAGGTLLEVHFDPPVALEEIRRPLGSVAVADRTVDLSGIEIQQFGTPNDILFRLSESGGGTAVADALLNTLRTSFPNSVNEATFLRRHEEVGPKIGEELRGAAVRAIMVSLVLILIYVGWRFHRAIWGVAAIIATFHDVLITLGLISILDVEISMTVIAALLTIVGYSLNDTIVVFDRIRENLRGRRRESFERTLNSSVNETLSRTLITGLTTLFAIAIMLAFGGEPIRDFNVTLLIGIVVGTYSSVFIASPVLLIREQQVERAEQAEKMGAAPQPGRAR